MMMFENRHFLDSEFESKASSFVAPPFPLLNLAALFCAENPDDFESRNSTEKDSHPQYWSAAGFV